MNNIVFIGEAIKTPQNYPDVTLHPVPPSPAQNTVPQQTGSLLHGILTKAQSPRPTTFSPTLARLLTAPERERNSPAAVATAVSMPQQSAATQHLLQAYQSGSNLGTISELLSSSKVLRFPSHTYTQLLATFSSLYKSTIHLNPKHSFQTRTEITITPVVNTPAQSHSNNMIHVVRFFNSLLSLVLNVLCIVCVRVLIIILNLSGGYGGRNNSSR